MAIKRRNNIPTGDEAIVIEPKGLVIVARDKKVCPPTEMTRGCASGADLRRLGPVSLACGFESADVPFSVGDTVRLLRTPYDEKNSQERRYRNRIKNRATAITAMCVVCTGSRKLVTECASTQCPLWAFRFGSDPFRGNRK